MASSSATKLKQEILTNICLAVIVICKFKYKQLEKRNTKYQLVKITDGKMKCSKLETKNIE